MIKNFINRPVLSTVISILIVILGILGIISLPISQYPEIAPPTVQVSASYGGANAETVLKAVVIPLEEQINGVENMDYITSSASNSGRASITVYFKHGTNADNAAVMVQNRVSYANAILPAEVKQAGVTVEKRTSGNLMFLSFFSENPELDDVFLQNYLSINVIPALKRINGVGDADVFGAKTYSMRVWLDPQKLQAYKLNPTEVTAAISAQSLEAAAGTLGQNSGGSYEYVIKYKGKYNQVSEYENVVIKALDGGRVLRLKDVAKVELDALTFSSFAESKGRPAVSMGISQTPGANAHEVVQNIDKYLKSIEKTLPEGITYSINFNVNTFLDAAISKVVSTLLEAFLLVFLVVYVFLQDFRSTLIPAIAVPVSIVGTFFFLNLFGYSINMLTLFALVLAIGIVVDDAIVVVEAVHAKMEQTHEKAKPATISAMNEITGAIISITLVMAAVFVPVTFISGTTGVFYKQFGITLIVAIIISAINALTLSPVLCSLFLKPHGDKEYEKKSWIGKFFHKFNIAFNTATLKYGQTFTFFLRHKWITLVLFAIAGGGIYYANKNLQSGFVPSEDQGFVMMNVELIPGASMERTANVLREASKTLSDIPGVANFTYITGNGMLSGSGSNNGMGFFTLKPFEERAKHPDQSIQAIIGKAFASVAHIKDARFLFFQPPSVAGFGISNGVSLVLLNKSGDEISQVSKTTQQFMDALMKRPEIQYVQTSFNTNYPQYQMDINVERAMQSGISVSSILSTLQNYIGGFYATDFTLYGKQYRVMVQSLPESRKDINSLNGLFVRAGNGEMAPISEFVTLNRVFGPQSLSRYNLFTSVSISANSNPGYSTGDAVKAVEEVAAQTLNSNYGIDYTGLTREEQNAGTQTIIIFMLSLIFTYFILSAQYESYLLPLSVLMSLPFGIFGAFLGQWLFGLENNIYFQISLIMLIGLLAKNAILIVEFAVQRRRHGESLSKAAINAAMARLRPILMTSFAFIVGLMPLVFATGVGSSGNRSVATGAAAGQLIGTFFGLVVIPVLFVIFQHLQERISGTEQKEEIFVSPTNNY
ncbi:MULTISPECIES: efflux RND transporter permease subunit [unclassified Capnocytophaga]|uniref:efflux RND transporter permease subunit n=1 Tax=unclassified Capnocytophaga TaxID=2640652 RepID=UPI000202D138|nr:MULTISPECIES: efflux RND transporter permease subunit [unclassified Capnocytophaga]EGD35083.1 HAE1 efflux family protein [Capnocytophaga sp. oral taxon 338 str. F0234]MEB3003947.1 efflux RND transporter permease subunit [Capnocytophaga sp. G2]